MNKKELLKKLEENGFGAQVLGAFQKVKREDFLPDDLNKYAYEDTALPIGHGQTISQPYTIALMLKLLKPQEGQRILEVGCGSGYVLALVDAMLNDGEILGTEIVEDLYTQCSKRLKGYKKITVHLADEKLGLPNQSFDRIIVSAAADEIPNDLVEQLKEGGIMVCPVKNSILKIIKEKDRIRSEEFTGFVFVPLIV